MNIKAVLIVDDDADDLEFFCDAVNEVHPGVQCISCTSGSDALNLLEHTPGFLPDLIFLDLNMPRMNGKQCLGALKKMPHLQHVPVIIYTTSKIPEDIKETRKLGAVDFISKPARFSELCQAIDGVFKKNWTSVNDLH